MLKKGQALVVMGAQFGDEGKGKLVDVLAADADVVCRVQGGNNAGHTVYVAGQKIVTHLVPLGILRKGCINLIGAGVVIDPFVLCQEIKEIQLAGYNVTPENLGIDPRAHVILPYHKFVDADREAKRSKSGSAIGTTGRGIGPTYASRAYRDGLRMGDLSSRENLEAAFKLNPHMTEHLDEKRQTELVEAAEFLTPFLKDAALVAARSIAHKKKLLFEGAQAALLDVSFGTYPFVTSSQIVSGSVAGGIGLSPHAIGQILGVIKAYSTRVGQGPMAGELSGSLEHKIRDLGKEYGATTGRPRRIGWLDLVALRYQTVVNGFTNLALMKSDVLNGLESVGVVVAYRDKRTGSYMKGWPMTNAAWDAVDPVVEFVPGWNEMVDGKNKLTKPFAAYVKRIEEFVDCRIKFISTGPKREEFIWV